MDECASRPCQHGGLCIDDTARYVCECNSQYTGQNCADLVIGANGKPPDAPTNGTLACEGTVSESTVSMQNLVGNQAGDYTLAFSLPPGTFTLQFDACQSTFDTVLRVMSPEMSAEGGLGRTEIASCDDCGPCSPQSLLDTIMNCADSEVDNDGTCHYILVVEGFGSDTGDFTVDMHCNQPHGVDGTIACAETVTGSTQGGANALGTGSSDHFYTFSLVTDSSVQFDSCLSSFDTFLRIYSSDMGTELHSCDNCGDCGTRTVLDADLRAGDYILVVEGYGAEEGDYDVVMSCPEQNFFDGAIECGQTVRGSTVGAGSHVGNAASDHIYSFTIDQGTHLVQMDSCNSDFDTYLRIMSPDLDTQLEACDNCGSCDLQTTLDAQLTCEEATCEYALVVEGSAELEGAYNVSMRCQEMTAMEGSVSCGRTLIGDTTDESGLSDGADHFYTFVLDEKKMLQFDSCDSSYDTFLRIFSPDLSQELHACDDCGACGTRSVLDVELPAGNYILVIGGWDDTAAGEYSVTMRCPQSRAGFVDGTVRCDQTISGSTVSVGSHVGNGAISRCERAPLQSISTAAASHYDTYLRIMSPDLVTEIAGCNDCGPCGEKTVLDAELVCDQLNCDYVLVVEGFGAAEGSFSVQMTCEDVEESLEGTIECGQTVAASTVSASNSAGSTGGDHMYNFTLIEATDVQFSSCESDYDTFLRIFSPSLTEELHACDDCGDCGTRSVLDVALDAGEYIIVIGGFASSEGSYSVIMNCETDGLGFHDGDLVCEQTVSGNTAVAPGVAGLSQAHSYSFTLPPGANIVQFDACASSFDTILRIMTPDLSTELESCDE